ncbi:MAG: hypothetical protein N4A72_01135 [Bacteroidales bacterium]|jgi:uncharacterized protein YnzC (UPF0291/DUF896 family)|nr:hypothetical protein [Bacteroidales bacterium]
MYFDNNLQLSITEISGRVNELFYKKEADEITKAEQNELDELSYLYNEEIGNLDFEYEPFY